MKNENEERLRVLVRRWGSSDAPCSTCSAVAHLTSQQHHPMRAQFRTLPRPPDLRAPTATA
jgi:hypothetical protein